MAKKKITLSGDLDEMLSEYHAIKMKKKLKFSLFSLFFLVLFFLGVMQTFSSIQLRQENARFLDPGNRRDAIVTNIITDKSTISTRYMLEFKYTCENGFEYMGRIGRFRSGSVSHNQLGRIIPILIDGEGELTIYENSISPVWIFFLTVCAGIFNIFSVLIFISEIKEGKNVTKRIIDNRLEYLIHDEDCFRIYKDLYSALELLEVNKANKDTIKSIRSLMLRLMKEWGARHVCSRELRFFKKKLNKIVNNLYIDVHDDTEFQNILINAKNHLVEIRNLKIGEIGNKIPCSIEIEI